MSNEPLSEAQAQGLKRIESAIAHIGHAQDELSKLHSSNTSTLAALHIANDNLERTLKLLRPFRGQGEMDLTKVLGGKGIIP